MPAAEDTGEASAAALDVSKPNIARVYDYWLGGKDNFAADRAEAERLLGVYPRLPQLARENRLFLARAVAWLAGQGIGQFLDVGSGLPAEQNTHEAAQAVSPGCRVVYADNDPTVVVHARALLHDRTLKPEDRVAGLLLLLYAQQPATISRLTLGHIQAGDGEVRLQLGREPVVLPEPLAGLILHLAAARRGHATTGDQGTSPWLLPGGRPGQPISPYRLSERLRQIGIQPGPARSAALFQLATELPAAILARMLGIHIDVAVAWQRISAGDWMTYAADVSHRPPQEQPSPSPGRQLETETS